MTERQDEAGIEPKCQRPGEPIGVGQRAWCRLFPTADKHR